ncbi:hypothetical protein HFO17_02415 [Rhizobium laguerreae]|uniref:hypothetical protein n=1 Tax=Rhizobium laguerreae TaxID=1076926 RepID=UPI001C92B718|nr:hypothetical protein [Rhizobium laguerreae]MBY3233426.1 hypothetical protein [Rhizobium laguerreae]
MDPELRIIELGAWHLLAGEEMLMLSTAPSQLPVARFRTVIDALVAFASTAPSA